MIPAQQKIRILFFIGSLKGGGKERRLIELLSYLQARACYELMVVVTDPAVHYPAFHDLNITRHLITKKFKSYDPTVFFQLYKICKQFKPNIIHTWGRIQTFYALPAVIGQNIPMVNGQITSAPPNASKWTFKKIIDRINFRFSAIILSNSRAGIDAYRPPAKKMRVIYNGINLDRFENLPAPDEVRSKYGIKTPYAVVMVATFSGNKDYDLFFKIAQRITGTRDDITFIAVGDHSQNGISFTRFIDLADRNPRILLTGRIMDVEALVNSCTIGVLFSNAAVHGEGISNAIMEYMSLARPVVANDAGGTKEIVRHGMNGYLVTRQSEDEIVQLITGLIDNPQRSLVLGRQGRKMIEESFSLDRMGKAFEQTYRAILNPDSYEGTFRLQRQQ